MEIRKIRPGVICISLIGASALSFREIAEKAYEAIGEEPPLSFELSAFSKDGTTLLFASKKEISAVHTGASRRLCTHIIN